VSKTAQEVYELAFLKGFATKIKTNY